MMMTEGPGETEVTLTQNMSTTTATTTITTTTTTTLTTMDHESYYKSLNPGQGQTWIIISIGVIPCVVFLLCAVLVVRYKWRRDAAGDPRGGPGGDIPCTSCQLVEMGEMVMMGEKCAKCGRSRTELNAP